MKRFYSFARAPLLVLPLFAAILSIPLSNFYVRFHFASRKNKRFFSDDREFRLGRWIFRFPSKPLLLIAFRTRLFDFAWGSDFFRTLDALEKQLYGSAVGTIAVRDLDRRVENRTSFDRYFRVIPGSVQTKPKTCAVVYGGRPEAARRLGEWLFRGRPPGRNERFGRVHVGRRCAVSDEQCALTETNQTRAFYYWCTLTISVRTYLDNFST